MENMEDLKKEIEAIKYFSTENYNSKYKSQLTDSTEEQGGQRNNREMEDGEIEIIQSDKKREKRLKGKKWAESQGTVGVQKKM